jgi:hypothetical protein
LTAAETLPRAEAVGSSKKKFGNAKSLVDTCIQEAGFLFRSDFILLGEFRIQNSSGIAQGRRYLGILQRSRQLMSLEWFHAMLGAFFVGVWIIVGQIITNDKR